MTAAAVYIDTYNIREPHAIVHACRHMSTYVAQQARQLQSRSPDLEMHNCILK